MSAFYPFRGGGRPKRTLSAFSTVFLIGRLTFGIFSSLKCDIKTGKNTDPRTGTPLSLLSSSSSKLTIQTKGLKIEF